MSKLSPISSRLSIKLDEEYRRMQNEWFFKWHFIGQGRTVEIDSFDGRTLKYGGIKYSGTVEHVYSATIQRYLRKKIGEIFDQVENELTAYSVGVRLQTLKELRSVIGNFAGNIRNEASEKDRVLRGNGVDFPKRRSLGEWVGSTGEDIESRISSLIDIYCDPIITIAGEGMSLKTMMTDKLTLVKKDGTIIRSEIPGRVTADKIITFAKDLPIEFGDHFLRKIPSGLVDDFVVIEPGYVARHGHIDSHFQTKISRSGSAISELKATIENITNNFYGNHSKVNIVSTDNSVNSFSLSDRKHAELKDFIEQTKAVLPSLPESLKIEIHHPLAVVESEILKSEPSSITIGNALHSIKSVAEGATGNLLASGILALIAILLS